jgi:COP9 signalosome complex subunit 1
VQVDDLEKEMATLIMDGRVAARIDSQNKVMFARQADQRNATYVKALSMGESFLRDAQAMFLHMNLVKHDFVVAQTGHAGAN